MARQFRELEQKMSPAARERSDLAFQRMASEMPLQKLRSARNFTQQGLAKILDVNQSEISKIESRTDMYVSTLASYIEAMGGELEICAVFKDGRVRIKNFHDVDAA